MITYWFSCPFCPQITIWPCFSQSLSVISQNLFHFGCSYLGFSDWLLSSEPGRVNSDFQFFWCFLFFLIKHLNSFPLVVCCTSWYHTMGVPSQRPERLSHTENSVVPSAPLPRPNNLLIYIRFFEEMIPLFLLFWTHPHVVKPHMIYQRNVLKTFIKLYLHFLQKLSLKAF